MYFTVSERSCEAALRAHFQAPGLSNQTAGTVDVYQILDATLEAGNTEEEDTAASTLLLKHEFLDGGHAGHPGQTTLENFLVRSNSQSSVASASFAVGGFQLEGHDPERLRLEHRAHLHADAGEAEGDVFTGTLTALDAATAASFAATGALTGATLTITGAASAGPLDCKSLDSTFTATRW